MKAVSEGQIPIALVPETHALRIGRSIFADTAVLDTLWRAARVFLPLALVTTLGFYFIYHITTTANRRILEAGQEKSCRWAGRRSMRA